MLQIPRTVEIYALDMPVKRGREKLREQFYKNANARDPRVIDMLVMKVCGIVMFTGQGHSWEAEIEWSYHRGCIAVQSPCEARENLSPLFF